MKRILALIVAAAALTLAGCANNSSRYSDRNYGGNSGYRVAATVEEIRYSEGSSRDGTAGAVIGGVVGGVAGNQIGGGSGRTAATIAGAVGGALIGNEIAKGNSNRYLITIRTDDGRYQTVESTRSYDLRRGDRVFFYPDNGGIERMY